MHVDARVVVGSNWSPGGAVFVVVVVDSGDGDGRRSGGVYI